MTRIPLSITYELSRNNAEPVSLLVSVVVIPAEQRSMNREAPWIDFPDGALVELVNGEPIGPWSGRLTEAEECDLEREVLAAFSAWEREQAEMAWEVA